MKGEFCKIIILMLESKKSLREKEKEKGKRKVVDIDLKFLPEGCCVSMA